MNWIGSTDHSVLTDLRSSGVVLAQYTLSEAVSIGAVSVYVSIVDTGLRFVQGYAGDAERLRAASEPLAVQGPLTGWVTAPLVRVPQIAGHAGQLRGGYIAEAGELWVGCATPSGVEILTGNDGSTDGRSVSSNDVPPSTGDPAPIPAAFALVSALSATPNLTDEELAGLGWYRAQAALSGAVLLASARFASVEWYGQGLDERLGAFAIVREDGPLVDLIGERVRVSSGRQSTRAYVVDSSDELTADLALTRRGFMALADASEDEIPAKVEVIGG